LNQVGLRGLAAPFDVFDKKNEVGEVVCKWPAN
jgi:hypothetical protein